MMYNSHSILWKIAWCSVILLLPLFVTRWLALMEQALLTLHDHMTSPPILNEVRICSIFGVLCGVLQTVVCPFYYFGQYVVCPSIYGFRLRLLYLQTRFVMYIHCDDIYKVRTPLIKTQTIILLLFSFIMYCLFSGMVDTSKHL